MKSKYSDETCYYFVDEAGDTVVFGKGKATRIGTDGASRFFLMGLLEVDEPARLTDDLDKLRRVFLADPRLNCLSGMRPEDCLTALQFHASDDHPIIRRKVYEFLCDRPGLRFTCIVKDKMSMLYYVIQRQTSDSAYKYRPEELYDQCVSRMFRERLHLHDRYEITFAKWNKIERRVHLETALKKARRNFRKRYKIKVENSINFTCLLPEGVGGLQVADYYLWAVQRMYEKQDDSYFQIVASNYHLIWDVDDRRIKGYGVYYNKAKPLTVEAVRGRL